MKRLMMIAMGLFGVSALWAQSPEMQAARQCRSVHLNYTLDFPARAMYLEVIPQTTAVGTYYAFLGFNGGYCGIQELYDGRHIAIFSVWDPGEPFDFSKHPDEVEEHMRTKELYAGEQVRVSRFGGEGTGGKSMMDLDWQVGKPVKMAVTCAPDGDHRTAYTCWVWREETKTWFRMATFSTLATGKKGLFSTCYSFVEDFRRDVKSKDFVRKAWTSRAWSSQDNLTWTASSRARFTADNNALKNIDAYAENNGFVMMTGGDTQNTHTRLWDFITLPEPIGEPPPELAVLSETLKTFTLR